MIVDSNGKQETIASERVSITAHPSAEGTQQIDFSIVIRPALDEVSIGGSNDDKGYGGFSTRLVMPKDLKFFSRSGSVKPIRTSIDEGGWISLTGTFGHESHQGKNGITILVHPESAGYPQRWILRQSGSMQNPVFPGRELYDLSDNGPFRLMYRLVLHDEVADAETINVWHEKYSQVEPVKMLPGHER